MFRIQRHQAEAPTPCGLRLGACSRSGASAGNQPGNCRRIQLAIALGHQLLNQLGGVAGGIQADAQRGGGVGDNPHVFLVQLGLEARGVVVVDDALAVHIQHAAAGKAAQQPLL